MTLRPSAFPDWATGNPAGIAQPSSADIATGWAPSQPPPAEFANYLQNTTAQWLRYLDEQGSSTVLASSLDFSTRLIGGGSWSLAGTTLTWNAPAYLAIPSANDGDNTIAAASLALPAGSVAYVTANMPFSTTATTASGSAQLTNVLYGDQAIVGQFASGPGIAAGTTVKTISADGQTITLSAPATASASGVTVTFRSSSTLPPQVAVSSSFVPGPNSVVFARGLDATVIVGVGAGQMLLRRGESKPLLGNGFTTSASFVAGDAINALVPVYVSQGSGSQTTGDAPRVGGRVYAASPEARMSQDDFTAFDAQRARVIGVTAHSAAAGAPVEVVVSGILSGYQFLRAGAEYYLSATTAVDPATGAPAGLQLLPPAGTNQYQQLVGYGLNSNTLLVLRSGPPVRVLANPVYKTVLPMGGIFAAGAGLGGAFGTTYLTVANQQTPSQSTLVPFQWTADRAGSVVGISYDYSNSQTFLQGAAILQINGARVNAASTGSQSASAYGVTFAKGTFPFNAGDKLSTYAGISSNNPNGATVSGTVALTLEFNP